MWLLKTQDFCTVSQNQAVLKNSEIRTVLKRGFTLQSSITERKKYIFPGDMWALCCAVVGEERGKGLSHTGPWKSHAMSCFQLMWLQGKKAELHHGSWGTNPSQRSSYGIQLISSYAKPFRQLKTFVSKGPFLCKTVKSSKRSSRANQTLDVLSPLVSHPYPIKKGQNNQPTLEAPTVGSVDCSHFTSQKEKLKEIDIK